jgi:hypothetical protein
VYDVSSARAVASGPLYASQTFWAAAGVAVAVLVGCGAIWASFRTAHPRRRLDCTVTHVPLMPWTVDDRWEVRYDGIQLTAPHVVTVVLSNRGRRDIASSAFDRSEPFRVQLTVPYAELVKAESSPRDAASPPAWIRDGELHIGPGRIGCGTTITYHVLVDTEPTYDCRHSLLDVRVQCTTASVLH